jgi:hypothetical protein
VELLPNFQGYFIERPKIFFLIFQHGLCWPSNDYFGELLHTDTSARLRAIHTVLFLLLMRIQCDTMSALPGTFWLKFMRYFGNASSDVLVELLLMFCLAFKGHFDCFCGDFLALLATII